MNAKSDDASATTRGARALNRWRRRDNLRAGGAVHQRLSGHGSLRTEWKLRRWRYDFGSTDVDVVHRPDGVIHGRRRADDVRLWC